MPIDKKSRFGSWMHETGLSGRTAACLLAAGMLVSLAACSNAQDSPLPEESTTAAATTTTTATATSAASTTKATTTTTTTQTTKTTTAAKKTTQSTQKTTATAVGNHYVQKDGAPWNLRLVNAWNPITKQESQSIALVKNSANSYRYDQRAVTELNAMVKAGAKYGIYPCSLFRSYDSQASRFNNDVAAYRKKGYSKADAEKAVARYLARPGTSEHNMGLAADLLGSGSGMSQSFENTAAFKWLHANCAEYGFILRYPKNKEAVTGVMYEPWHYRYVGKEHAKTIMSNGRTLEEYLEKTGQ